MRLHLVISDLFGVLDEQQLDHALQGVDSGTLARLLARAGAATAPDRHSALLASLFGLPPQQLPVAAFTHLADSGQPCHSYCLRADPVHLKADRDRLILYRARDLVIGHDEARQFVSEINTRLGEPGWHLEAGAAQRWYLHLSRPPAMQTRSPQQALGQDCYHTQPTGPDAPAWRRRINEIQMLLHASPLNEARRASGLDEINSLWLWGGGVLPPLVQSRWNRVMARDPLARGLALASGDVGADLPATLGGCAAAADDEVLVVVERCGESLHFGDLASWQEWFRRCNRNWIEPLEAALRSGRISAVTLYPGRGRRFTLTARSLRRWWRRVRPLSALAH